MRPDKVCILVLCIFTSVSVLGTDSKSVFIGRIDPKGVSIETQVRNQAPQNGMGENGRGSVSANSTVVRLCYGIDDTIKKGCEKLNEKLIACGVKVLTLWDPTPDDIRAFAKKHQLPPSTNFLLSSHGVPYDGDHILPMPDGRGESIDSSRFKVSLSNGTQVNNFVRSQDIVEAVTNSFPAEAAGHKPSVWMSTCHSGQCLSPGHCVGAACKPNEVAYMDAEGLEATETHLADLLCHADKFHAADVDGNGILDHRELAANFCTKFGPRLVSRSLYQRGLVDFSDRFSGSFAEVKSEDELKLYEAASREKNPGLLVSSGRTSSLWAIEFEGADGTAQIASSPTVWDSREGASQVFKNKSPSWPAECNDLVLNGKATHCRLKEVAEVWSIEVRDPSGQACVHSSESQHVDTGTFRLYPAKDQSTRSVVTH